MIKLILISLQMWIKQEWLEKSAALPLAGYPHGHQLIQGVAE